MGTKTRLRCRQEPTAKLETLIPPQDLSTKRKLAVDVRGNKFVATKLELPPLGEKLKELFREIDKRYKRERRPTEREILA